MITPRRAFLFATLLLLCAAAGACEDEGPVFPPVFHPGLEVDLDVMTRTSSGLYYLDEEVGTGDAATLGDSVEVAYEGFLSNGSRFTTSQDIFLLQAGGLIPGFLEGILGMREGGERRLVIRPELGYGSRANGPIPPNSTLIFDIELLRRWRP